eukprot:405529_1
MGSCATNTPQENKLIKNNQKLSNIQTTHEDAFLDQTTNDKPRQEKVLDWIGNWNINDDSAGHRYDQSRHLLIIGYIHMIERKYDIKVPNDLIIIVVAFYSVKFFLDSDLLQITETIQLLEWISNGVQLQYKLLFKASDNEFSAYKFHEKCDDNGTTIIIAQSEHNHIFGGYTSRSWKQPAIRGQPQWKTDTNAWIYVLSKGFHFHVGYKGDKYKWSVKNSAVGKAIYTNSSCGPTFGPDFCISDQCNLNQDSYSNLGKSYAAPRNDKMLAGSPNFKVIDYECWKVI